MSIEHTLFKFLKEDVFEVNKKLSKILKGEIDAKYSPSCVQKGNTYIYNVTFIDNDTDQDVNYKFKYRVDGEDIYLNNELDEIAEEIADEFLLNDDEDLLEKGYDTINSSTYVQAAESDDEEDTFEGFDDESDNFSFDNTDDDNLGDTIDEMSDTLDDMQDQLDDIVEDDPSIQIDNNISNHYIVECEKCKGIFISSIEESDAVIEKVSGRCPLCGKDSDQYIKWVIRDVNSVDDNLEEM